MAKRNNGRTVEMYPSSDGNGYTICVLTVNDDVDFGFTVSGASVKFPNSVKAMKALNVKIVKLSQNTKYYDLVKADLIDAGFEVDYI